MQPRHLATLIAALLCYTPALVPTAGAQTPAGNELILLFGTGGDDLRGGHDNVHVELLVRSGTPPRFENVNESRKWGNNSRVTVRRPLPASLQFADILGMRVEVTASGGMGGDNWNLNQLTVSARLGGVTREVFTQSGSPLFRFTGDRRVREFRFSSAPIPRAAAVMTRFQPAIHGFRFDNSFKNIVISAIDWTTSGLCGGMSYAALDYFTAGRPIPTQDYKPAEGTPLQSYIYGRQTTSITANLDKWGEYGFNPGGSRNREFFNWGLQAGSGRLGELRARIDRGQPVPLGLQSCGDACGCPHGCSGSHQVLAIGYEMGRYVGDLGEHIEDFTIFVYDPNYPGETKTLKPNVAGAMYLYPGAAEKRWRAYFVDTKYSAHVPLAGTTTPSDELLVEFGTGGDDLRGGNDNVHVLLMLRGRTPLRFPNVNNQKRWINNSNQSVALALPAGIRPEDIEGVRLETTFGGGMGGDNWNLNRLAVRVRVGGAVHPVLTQWGSPLFRFTGSQRVREFRR